MPGRTARGAAMTNNKTIFVDPNGVRYVLDHSQLDNTPLFDWRQLLPEADTVIARVGAARTYSSAAGIRVRKGLQLSGRREKIARLLAEALEKYLEAKDDFETRNSPERPKRRRPDHGPEDAICDFDYGKYAADCFDTTWEECWDDLYARGRGNPGTNRAGGPPIAPLRWVYILLRDWWRAEGLGRFHPTFSTGKLPDEPYAESDLNPASRFLLSMIQVLDARYSAENARSLYEHMRRR